MCPRTSTKSNGQVWSMEGDLLTSDELGKQFGCRVVNTRSLVKDVFIK